MVATVAVSVLLGGCDDDGREAPAAVRPTWHEVALPLPPGPTGRIALRDATWCAGRWYAVGAVLGDDGASRPAAWTSADARSWRSVPTDPTDFYAKQAILYSVACRDGQIAAIGAKSGGAHGNPRTGSWRQRPDGTLVDVRAGFELYGGPAAISVKRIAAGPDDWLIAGTRTSGAVVWESGDASDFRLLDDDPELSSDAYHRTVGLDAVHDPSGWTVVGRAQVSGRVGPAPLAWTSTDGIRWQRKEVPAETDGYADLQRVTREGDDLVAVGLRGHRFGVWRRSAGNWQPDGAFGSLRRATSAPFVSGIATAQDRVLVTGSDGRRFGLWAELGSEWRDVVTPTRPPGSGDAQLTVAAGGETVLLLADDGTSGRAWTSDWNTLGR